MHLGPAPASDNPLSVQWWYVPPEISSEEVVETGEIDWREGRVVFQESHTKFLVRWEDRETFLKEVLECKLPHPEGFSDKIVRMDYRNAPGGFTPVSPKIPAAEFTIVWLKYTGVQEFVHGEKED